MTKAINLIMAIKKIKLSYNGYDSVNKYKGLEKNSALFRKSITL